MSSRCELVEIFFFAKLGHSTPHSPSWKDFVLCWTRTLNPSFPQLKGVCSLLDQDTKPLLPPVERSLFFAEPGHSTPPSPSWKEFVICWTRTLNPSFPQLKGVCSLLNQDTQPLLPPVERSLFFAGPGHSTPPTPSWKEFVLCWTRTLNPSFPQLKGICSLLDQDTQPLPSPVESLNIQPSHSWKKIIDQWAQINQLGEHNTKDFKNTCCLVNS